MKGGASRAASGSKRETVDTDAKWPRAQVVMSGQLALQQLCLKPLGSDFCLWQGMSAMLIWLAAGAEAVTLGAADTA
jgi:hypothetical protein